MEDADGPLLSGTFSDDRAKALVASLYALTKVGIEKIILDFKKEDDKKSLYINALNTTGTVFVRIYYDGSLLDGFELKESFKYGIAKLPDFVTMVNMFKDGFTLKMSPEMASFSVDENYLDYYGAETSKIKRGEEGEIDSTIVATITCDDSFKTFISAIGKVEQNNVIFRGTKTDKESFVTLTITDKDVRGNAFTRKVPVDIAENFKVAINKEFFISVLTPGTTFNIYREVIQLKKTDPLYNMEYFISTLL